MDPVSFLNKWLWVDITKCVVYALIKSVRTIYCNIRSQIVQNYFYILFYGEILNCDKDIVGLFFFMFMLLVGG